MARTSLCLLLLQTHTAIYVSAGSLRGAAPNDSHSDDVQRINTSAIVTQNLTQVQPIRNDSNLSSEAQRLNATLGAAYNPVCSYLPWLCYQPSQPRPPAPSQRHGATCADYGCVDYVSWHQCQCNSGCERHGNCCSDYWSRCRAPSPRRRRQHVSEPRRRRQTPTSAPRRRRQQSGQNIMTLYHETSPEIAELILSSSFRPGNSGWCGGAIYFYNKPRVPDSKLGPDSHAGAVIEAQVAMGRVAHLDSKCHSATDAKRNYDSIIFNPGDGNEFVIWDGNRVLSMKRYS